MMKFQQKVYAAVRRIPRGTVATYGAVARMIEAPRAARAVGNALNKNNRADVPCHRVVRADGSVGGFNRGAQSKMRILRHEGVSIRSGVVDMGKHTWAPVESYGC